MGEIGEESENPTLERWVVLLPRVSPDRFLRIKGWSSNAGKELPRDVALAPKGGELAVPRLRNHGGHPLEKFVYGFDRFVGSQGSARAFLPRRGH
jgi:hypothetical protein